MKNPFFTGLVFFIVSACGKKQESLSPAVENISESVYASGIVKSRGQYQVFSPVSGLIAEVLVKEGDSVKKGQPLLRIMNEQARLNAANARLASELADFNTNGDKLGELKTAVDFARTKLKNDSLLLARQRNLWEQQIGSRNDLDQRELAFRNSQTNYEAALLRYADTRRQLEFTARQARNSVQISNSVAADFIIRSEVAGRLYSLMKERGEMVSPQSPVAVIGDAGDFSLELQVDEYDITRVAVGQRILLSMDSYRGRVFEARVDKIVSIMNERSRTFTVEASFAVKPPSLFPNLTVEANILIRTKEKALTIPRSYLVEDSFVLGKDGKKIRVQTGLKDYKKVEILGGLRAADIIYKPQK